jgi:hypothetical protein
MGQERVARKLSVGYESFALLNQPKTDVNLRFSTSNMQRLDALLDPRERSEFLLLWKPKANTTHSNALAPGAAPRFGLSSTTAAAAAAAAAAGKAGPHGSLLQPSGSEEMSDDVIKAKLQSTSSRCTSVDGENLTSGSSSDVELHTSDGEDCCCSSSSSADSSSSSPKPAGAAAGQRQQKQRGAVLSPEKQQQVQEMRAIPLQWRDFHINLGAFLYCTVFRMPEPAKFMPMTREQCMNWLNIKPEDAFVRHQFNLYK